MSSKYRFAGYTSGEVKCGLLGGSLVQMSCARPVSACDRVESGPKSGKPFLSRHCSSAPSQRAIEVIWSLFLTAVLLSPERSSGLGRRL